MTESTIEANKELARVIPEDVATAGDVDRLDEILAESFVEHGPMGDEHGIETAKEGWREVRNAFPDLTVTVEDVVAEGDTVAMRVTLRGTHEGEYFGVDPTGESFEMVSAVFTRIEDGHVAERWVYPDTLGAFDQLGLVDAPTP
jgi:predicted ester cyclase